MYQGHTLYLDLEYSYRQLLRGDIEEAIAQTWQKLIAE